MLVASKVKMSSNVKENEQEHMQQNFFGEHTTSFSSIKRVTM